MKVETHETSVGFDYGTQHSNRAARPIWHSQAQPIAAPLRAPRVPEKIPRIKVDPVVVLHGQRAQVGVLSDEGGDDDGGSDAQVLARQVVLVKGGVVPLELLHGQLEAVHVDRGERVLRRLVRETRVGGYERYDVRRWWHADASRRGARGCGWW